MGAVGFTGGDPAKVDIAGDTMTGPLILSGDPTLNLGAATKQYAESQGGGGSGTPSGTVVTETSFGQSANAGVSSSYSRGDHTHGTPASPATPTGKIKTDTLKTDGNITVAAGPTLTQLGGDLVIAAVTGDVLEIGIQALCANTGSDVQFEAATRNSTNTADVNYWSTGTNSLAAGGGGVGSWYVQGSRFDGPRGGAVYAVQAGDINGGNVRVRMYGFGAGGSRVVNANTSYAFRWYVKNLGQ